jgi:TonB family protein
MSSFLLYQLKAGICIMLFTGFYYVLFRKETFHRFNRIYLLSSFMLSAVIPAVQLYVVSADSLLIPTRIIGAVNVYAGKGAPNAGSEINTISVPLLSYIIISFLFSIYLIYQVLGLIILIARRGFSYWGNYRIVLMPENTYSFSFFNLVFLSQPASQIIEENPVLLHEMAHARQLHSFDILLVQIIKIFQWFNPFVYFAEKALQETHEYLADTAVLEQDGQPERYRLLLLNRVFGIQPGIFSFFNHSLLKNRLTMMTKEKSPPRNRLKYLAALPLVLLMGLVMCCKQHETKDVAPPPPPPPPPPAEITTTADEPALVFVDEQAEFQEGDINDFREWVQKNLTYPPEAVKAGIFGRVTVQFAVNSAGKIGDIKILRSVSPMLDKETIRVLESSPDWVPAKAGGKNVKQQFVIPVVFTLE